MPIYRTLLIPCLCLLIATTVHAAGASENLAKVDTATFLGSEGTEWFTAGAFPGDDSILITGVTLNGDLTLRGTRARVLGSDAPAVPAPKEYRILGGKDTGKIALPDTGKLPTSLDEGGSDIEFTLDEPPTKEEVRKLEKERLARLRSVSREFQFTFPETIDQKTAYIRLIGNEKSATGFIARFDGSLKKVRALFRLPRGAGSIHSVAIGEKGNIYIAGGATKRIEKLSKDRRTESIKEIPAPGTNAHPFNHVYIAKLSPDLSKVLWVRDLKAWSWLPKLTVLKDGNIVMIGPGYLKYDPDGKLLQATPMPKTRISSGSAVNPVTGHYTRVGDWMSPTGREPWRCPRLTIYRPDGSTYKYLLGWRGPFFCPNHFHLVADSAVRRSAYDSEGNLYYSTWSHGGNNCMGRRPFDPETLIPNAMGYTGGSTYAFVVKLGPDHNVKTSTLWTSAGSVRTLDVACDKSVVWVGKGNMTPNLPNTFNKSGGMLLIVTEPNLASYRFASAMPAVGTRVAVGGCGERVNEWAFASGTVNGKPMLLCLSGALAEEKTTGGTVKPPLKNPVQDKYAGGLMDGYAVLMDLTPKTQLKYDPPEREHKPRPFKPYEGPRRLWPKAGQVWKIGTEDCTTVKVTFRDENNEMWPSFFHGRGVAGGTFTYGKKSATADFTLDCPKILQTEGLQHQRVLGELVTAAQKGQADMPKLKVHVTDMSPWEETGRKYGRKDFPVGECTIGGMLELNGKKIPFKDAPCSSSFSYPYKKEHLKYPAPNYALPSARFSVPGKALGLTGKLADQQIQVSVAWEAVSEVEPEDLREDVELPEGMGSEKKIPDLEKALEDL
ncbi:MAG: hypothetical protein ACLFVU_00710 [Phycisphaerae bacterium]